MIEGFCVGYAKFTDRQKPRALKMLLTEDVINTLKEKEEWWICHGQYYDQKWNIIFSLMQQANPYKLELGRNLNPRIIKQVYPIKFTCLQQLCFGKNKIESIEMITKINAPELKWLSFQENYITSLKPLRKAFFPKLKIINLKFNKLKQIDLHQFKAPNLAKICLQFHFQEQSQGENLNWFLKLQAKSMKVLRCRNQNRIVNKLLEEQFYCKYKELDYKKWNINNVNLESQSDRQ